MEDTTLTGDECGIVIEKGTMSSLLGRIDEYDGTKEDWSQHVERVDHFFAANGITVADKKKSAFLAVIGLATYALARNLVSPDKPGEKSYDELVKAMKDHFNPTLSETIQRARFKSYQEAWGDCRYICLGAVFTGRVLQLWYLTRRHAA